MGAISVVFPLGQLIVGLGLLFENGFGSYISRLLGRGDKETANKAASTALYSGLAVGAVFILFSVIFLNPILSLLGASVVRHAKSKNAKSALRKNPKFPEKSPIIQA